MNFNRRARVFTTIMAGGVLFSLAALVGFFTLFINREHIRQSLNKEKLAHERTVSEKLLADKDLVYLQQDFNKLDVVNQRLNELLDNRETDIRDKNLTIQSLSGDISELKGIQKELNGMKVNNKELDAQLKLLSQSITDLIARNNQMVQKLADLAEEQDRIRLEYEKKIVHKGIGRGFRVDAIRGNKLTTKAKRTRKFEVSFEPIDRNEFMKLKDETYYIVLSDETGGVYNLLRGERVTVHLGGNPVDLMPSFILKAAENSDKINRISLAIDKLELSSGIYNLDVYTRSAFVGSTQIRLN
ncbi:MAG: hypothetical protein ACK417_13070 [Bacteroidia bacterium]